MKFLLIGQAPSQHGDPTKPLTGRIGKKIARLARVSMFMYLRKTERYNLMGSWHGKKGKGDVFLVDEARTTARSFFGYLRNRHILFIGRAVANAFYAPGKKYCEWRYSKDWDCHFAILPHLSGIVRWWNDPENTRQASIFLQNTFQTKENKNGKKHKV
jgi:hypothetical protein